MISPYIGKIIDRSGPFRPMRIGVLVMTLGYLILYAGKLHIGIVVAGIILLDMGLQSAHVPNMSRNYALLPEARTRLNTLYMTSFFIGGSIGSALGSVAWDYQGWSGVCSVGLVMIVVGAVVVFGRAGRK